MKRRQFIAGLGSAAAWSVAAWAQQGSRVRRVGVLIPYEETDPGPKIWLSGFTQALAGLGWIDGRNVRMDVRWGGNDTNRIRALAKELVGLQPDIILTNGTQSTVALQPETRTIPIVFVGVTDPVAQRIVPRLNQPGGNLTGFAILEASLGGKWLELLSEIAPGLAAARNNVPAVYWQSEFARDGGGLFSYGPDGLDIWRRAATYVDRILRGAKPGDLPVQFPTKFEMAVNLKTAKALGLTVPQSILLTADEVIE
jgi:ABC-type uncharacterized transport system substrate-binding protein